jgi:hypothetical protein
MSFYTGIEKVRAAGDRVYVRPGRYMVEVLEAKQGDSPKDGVPFFNVEYVVRQAEEGSSHKVGDIINHHIRKKGTPQEKEKQLGEVKACVAAIMGIDAAQVDGKGCEVFTGPTQPGKGKLVAMFARNKPTKAGKDFTVISYPRLGTEQAVA